MKKIFQRASLALLVASSVSVAHATNFDINAEFVNDVTLNTTSNMNFGQLAVTSTTGTGGTAVISPTGVLTQTDDVAIVDASAVSAASIEVTTLGAANVALSIADATLTGANNGGSLTVNNFTFESVDGAGNIISFTGGATKAVSIGATLVVPATTAVDTYNGTATVTAVLQ